MNKFNKFIVSFLLCITVPITASASTINTIVTVTNLNNTDSSLTYKISESDFSSCLDQIGVYSETINKNLGTSYKNIQNLSEVSSWLSEKDIISTDSEIASGLYGVDTVPINHFNLGGNISRSDFMMMLCKSFYGLSCSRPIAFHSRSNLRSNKIGDEVNDYSEGNYYLYQSPNVYELYFTKLLDKGIIGINDFKNLKFRREYENLTLVKPDWFNNSDNLFNTVISKGSPLGQSFSFNVSGANVSTSFQEPSYFIDETISRIDALRYIEKLLRINEKDMTKAEADIISYKYGATYLKDLDSETSNTLTYLISLGVLDFENDEECIKLYESLDSDFLKQVIYRVCNKAARKDFSKVQLTDSDNYLLSQGLHESKVGFYEMSTDASVVSCEKYNSGSQVAKLSDDLVQNAKPKYQDLNLTKYKVKLRFKDELKYIYNGTPIGDLKVGTPADIISIDTEGDYNVIEFEIEAPSSVTAVRVITSRVTLSSEDDAKVGNLNSISSVSSDGTTFDYFISKAEIEKLAASSSNPEIVVIGDKYLINRQTNTSAIILDDDKIAMIGNEVISTDKAIVRGIKGEVYYNLKILARLMTNTYIDKLKDDRIIKDNLYSQSGSDSSAIKQRVMDVRNYYDKSDLEKYTTLDKALVASYKFGDKQLSCISLLHSQNVNSVIYKNIQPSTRFNNPVYLLVEWRWVLPKYDPATGKHQLTDTSIDNLSKYYNDSSNPSVQSMNSFLNSKPTDSDLQAWWNSNKGFSNSLCNFIYNTSGVEYFHSGYIAPSVSILSEEEYTTSELEEIFSLLKFDGNFSSNYLNGANPLNAMFGMGTGTYGSLAQARKFQFIKGSRDSSSDLVEYGTYFAQDKTGCFYKTVGDSDGTYDKTLGVYEKCVKTVTRETTGYSAIKPNQTYTLNDSEFICEGEESVDGEMYYRMSKKSPLHGSVLCHEDGHYIFTEDSSSMNLDSWYNNFTSRYDDKQMYKGTDHKTILAEGCLGSPSQSSVAKYYVHGGSYSDSDRESMGIKLDENYVISVDPKDGSRSEVVVNPSETEDDVYTTPVVFLKKNKWSCKAGSKELTPQEMTPYTDRENLLSIGLTKAVMDSIALKSYDAVSVADIPEGSTVIIGDLTFTAKYGKLISHPIQNSVVLSKLNDSLTDENVNSSICYLLDGMGVSIVNNGVVSDGSALSQFVKTSSEGKHLMGLSTPIEDITDKDIICLVSSGGNVKIKTNDDLRDLKDSKTFNSFCFYLSLEPSIKFRPIDGTGDTYSIVNCVEAGANGNLSDMPFFTTSLCFNWDSDLFGKTGSNLFKAATDAFGLMTKIQQAHAEAFRGDIKGLLCIWVIDYLAYEIVMTFILFVCRKIGIIYTIFYNVKHPTASDRGIDLVRLFSLGLDSMDSEPSGVRAAGTVGILVIVLAVFLKFIY